MRKIHGLLIIAIIMGSLFFFVLTPMIANFNPWFGAPTLEFPVQEPNNVTKLSGFNHPDWGSPGDFHNGIDLVCTNYTTILSPVSGMIIGIYENNNPYKNFVMFHISIMVNYEWQVNIVFEPNYNTSEGNDLQRSLIMVHLFQMVSVGDVIGYLLNGTGDPTYPHIHFMLSRSIVGVVCPYQYSSATAKTSYETAASITGETICYPGPSADAWWIDIAAYLIVTAGICVIVVVIYLVRRKNS